MLQDIGEEIFLQATTTTFPAMMMMMLGIGMDMEGLYGFVIGLESTLPLPLGTSSILKM